MTCTAQTANESTEKDPKTHIQKKTRLQTAQYTKSPNKFQHYKRCFPHEKQVNQPRQISNSLRLMEGTTLDPNECGDPLNQLSSSQQVIIGAFVFTFSHRPHF